MEQWNETKESRERICCRIGYNQNLLNRDLLWLKKSCITLLKAVEGGVDINLDSFEDYKKDKFSL